MNKETLERIKRGCTNIDKLGEEAKQYLYENKTENQIFNLDYWLWDFEDMLLGVRFLDCCIIKYKNDKEVSLVSNNVIIDQIQNIKVVDNVIKIETENKFKVDYNILDTINFVEDKSIYYIENDKLQITLMQKCRNCRLYKYKFDCKK